MSRDGIKRCVGWSEGENSYFVLELYSFHGSQAGPWACDHQYFFPPYSLVIPNSFHLSKMSPADLTGVAWLTGHHPAKGKGTSSIPGWGTFLDCSRRFGSRSGYKQEATE